MNYALDTTENYKTMNEREIREYDFVISNYGFAELSREFQDIYLKKANLIELISLVEKFNL